MHPLKDPLAPAAKSSPSELTVFDYDYDAAAGDGRDCGQAAKNAPSKRKNFDCDYDPVGATAMILQRPRKVQRINPIIRLRL